MNDEVAPSLVFWASMICGVAETTNREQKVFTTQTLTQEASYSPRSQQCPHQWHRAGGKRRVCDNQRAGPFSGGHDPQTLASLVSLAGMPMEGVCDGCLCKLADGSWCSSWSWFPASASPASLSPPVSCARWVSLGCWNGSISSLYSADIVRYECAGYEYMAYDGGVVVADRQAGYRYTR